jgi:hypothetical protein
MADAIEISPKRAAVLRKQLAAVTTGRSSVSPMRQSWSQIASNMVTLRVFE